MAILKKSKIYLETSFISYLVSKASKNIFTKNNQLISKLWWKNRRLDFELYSSIVTIQEAEKGDPILSQKRKKILDGITILQTIPEVSLFATTLITSLTIPPKAYPDALHIAFAIIFKLDFLLTWNCSHIANAEILKKILILTQKNNLSFPFICTPNELLGENP